MASFFSSLLLLSLPHLSAGYSWSYLTAPTQCGNFSVGITGSGGTPPYRLFIIPFGASPLPNNIEARRILDMPFNGSETTISFKLTYPENSQFVAVVSDATGFGSGGTSVANQVETSNDASCFNPTENVSPDFVFSIQPLNQIVQCQSTRIWWDASTVQGTPNFLGIIPGGQSFAIPESAITNVSEQGTGFSWTPNVRGGSTLLIAGGDNRGNGTGGSTLNTVSSGINNDNSCLDNNSPSSTPGAAAGGSYPTSTTSSSSSPTSSSGGNKDGGGSTNIGAIVGGVVGGIVAIVALLLLLLFFHRRRRLHKKQKEQPVDLLHSDEGDERTPGARRNELPQYYQPEPFIVPDPSTSDDRTSSEGRPLSGFDSTTRSGTPDPSTSNSTTTTTRKGGMRPLRPVNIIQHADAGPSNPALAEAAEEPETIELPPAYTNLRK